MFPFRFNLAPLIEIAHHLAIQVSSNSRMPLASPQKYSRNGRYLQCDKQWKKTASKFKQNSFTFFGLVCRRMEGRQVVVSGKRGMRKSALQILNELSYMSDGVIWNIIMFSLPFFYQCNQDIKMKHDRSSCLQTFLWYVRNTP